MFDSYEVGTRCWVHSKTIGWEDATVEAKRVKSATECELDLVVGLGTRIQAVDDAENASEHARRTVVIKSDPAPELPLRNPPVLEATSDLVTLSYLNEPSVLHAIRQRYSQLNIYTFSGIVLIATNPFDRVDNLYTNEVVQMYSGRQRGELEPHLFSIAEDAFRCMQRDNKNQTIVVSGESGAGKTMSAKYIMRYFATVEDPQKQSNHSHKHVVSGADESTNSVVGGDAFDEDDGLSKVEREILATNPIMEAFGNAKTTRNDNSSRFGKYLEIRFDEGLNISGARIRTYLLERSRIVFHQDTERNYHIFYQLLRGLEADKLAKLGLDVGLEKFHYVNQGDPDIAGVDDARDFKETCQALDIVGVTGEKQWRVFELLAGLLHLGNIELKSTSRSVIVSQEDPALVECCRLLGVNPVDLAKWLTKKQLKMRSENIVSDLDAKSAVMVRDSIAKYLYSALFDWLVAAVNNKLYVGAGTDRFIGVLDIYGFEHFKHNSFEQFCINYANEKLQQEFNRHVFKLEQQEYTSEEIDWQYIDFVDNQPCIALIEDRSGILSILDEESRLPAGTDTGFTQKLYGSLKDKPNFRVPRLGESSFIVAHYAHDVEYDTAGFLEKNRDSVPDTVVEVLNDTKNEFLNEVLDLQAAAAEAKAESTQAASNDKAAALGSSKLPGGPPGPKSSKRPTLGRIFKTSLIELMDTISSTNAHYIRCIKPNEQKEAWMFDGPMVLSQLRACGVLETIRISSKGFPGRWIYEEFASRYGLLLPSAKRNTSDPRELTMSVLEGIEKELGDEEAGAGTNANRKVYALGKTKVFLRAGMLGKLENLRTKRHQSAAIQIQRLVKMLAAQRRYRETLEFVQNLQTVTRGKLMRIRAEQEMTSRATIGVQSLIRRYNSRKQFQEAVASVVGVQNAFRSKLARANAEKTQLNLAAVSIQTLVRARQTRQLYTRQVKSLTTVQSMVRRRGAKQQLKQLKEDQNSVQHFEEKQYRMENKVVELQNALASKREEHRSISEKLALVEAALQTAQSAMAQHLSEHQEKSAAWESKNRELQTQAESHQSEVENLREELQSQRKHIEQLLDTLEERERAVQHLTMEASEYKLRAERLEEQLQQSMSGHIGTSAIAYHQQRSLMNDPYAANSASLSRNTEAGVVGGNAYHAAATLDELSQRQNEISEEIEEILRDPSKLQAELIGQLIGSLEVPTKSIEKLPELDVKFPANITNLLVSELWRFGQIASSESLIAAVYKAIQDTAQRASGEQVINVIPFWITNLHEIYSFFALAEENIHRTPEFREQMDAAELEQYAHLTEVAKADAVSAIFNVYWVYMRELKKMVDKMIISAMVEDQAIPGFLTDSSSNRLFSTLFSSSSNFKMDDLILLLTKIVTALKSFYLEEQYTQYVLSELLTLIGYRSFNDMIMRRNFLSWRRGVQISYNATRIQEWCKGHGLEALTVALDPIMQATKLLQLKKNWNENDISIIYDICWSLNPLQIQKLMANYQANDYENPISGKMQDILLKNVKEQGSTKDQLLLAIRPLSDAGELRIPLPRKLDKLEPYIPSNLDVPLLRELTELTTTSSRINEDTLYIDQAQREIEGEHELADSANTTGEHPSDHANREVSNGEAHTHSEHAAYAEQHIRGPDAESTHI